MLLSPGHFLAASRTAFRSSHARQASPVIPLQAVCAEPLRLAVAKRSTAAAFTDRGFIGAENSFRRRHQNLYVAPIVP